IVFTWMYLNEFHTRSVTTGIPLDQRVGPLFADALLFSPVFNFPPEFAGPDQKINIGNAQALHGLWNGSSYLTQQYLQPFQRFQNYGFPSRFPVYETECSRFTGLAGPRFAWIWERYHWITTSLDVADSTPNPSFQGIYSNIVSNRMYGVTGGFSQECYLGHG